MFVLSDVRLLHLFNSESFDDAPLSAGGDHGKDGGTIPTLSRTISMPVDIAGKRNHIIYTI